MADAPSGGSSWEPFEIVLVVILVIGLLMHLEGTKTTTTPPKKTTTAPVIQQTPPENNCGLTISRPHSLEKVTNFVTLMGATNGCNWNPKDGVALYAQLVDAHGMPVSAYTAVPVKTTSDPSLGGQPVSSIFDTSIYLTQTPVGGIGYLILIPASGNQSITSRIPLKF